MGIATHLYEELWKHLEASAWDKLMALFTDDVDIIFQDAVFSGAAPLRTYLSAVMDALPDLTHEISDVIESGDGNALAGVVIARGTHATAVDMFGSIADVAGRLSVFQAVDMIWVRDGRICKWWAMYDPVERARSLGLTLRASDGVPAA